MMKPSKHLKPVVDLFHPVARAALQHVAAMRSRKARSTSFIEQTLGVTPSISTFMLRLKRISRSELRNIMFIRTSGSTFLDLGSRMMRMSSADSSRTSARIGTFLVWISSAIFSISLDFWT